MRLRIRGTARADAPRRSTRSANVFRPSGFKARGKPGKLALAAVMRKLVLLANALLRDGRKWTDRPA